MKTILASIALFVAGVLAQNFTINTPSNVVECEPTQITWTGGTAPYFLSVLPGASPSGPAIESLPQTSSTSYTWTVNVLGGTSIGLTLRDSNGNIAQTAAFNVNPGSSSCLNSTSGVSGSTPSSTSAASASTTGTTTTTTTGTSAGATTNISASPSPSPTTGSSGASANVAQFGAAGIIGAAVAALFL